MLFTMICTMFSGVAGVPAYAADTTPALTTVPLDDRARFTVSLQSNTLVFSNEPTDKRYDSVSLELVNADGAGHKVTYNRGQGNGATINLKDLSDGTYNLSVGYKNYEDNKNLKYLYYPDNYDFTVVIKGGTASFQFNHYYENNLKMSANERTDVYALDSYKGSPEAAYIKQANIITAGITDDYLKVKAIHDWVSDNMYYEYCNRDGSGSGGAYVDVELFPGAGTSKSNICAGFTGTTVLLLQAAGFPAKYITGGTYNDGGQGHAWTEVYVDNRWLFMDTTFDCNNSYYGGEYAEPVTCSETYFDMSLLEYSETHELTDDTYEADKTAWDGSLCIVEQGTNKLLKEIKKYPLGGLVTSTYGYNANDMYIDSKCTKHWNFATDRVRYGSNFIYIKAPKPCSVFFAVVDNRGYLIPSYLSEEYQAEDNAIKNCVLVSKGSKLTKPADPKLKGYIFIGWYNDDTGEFWDFETDVVTDTTTLMSHCKNESNSFTVSFNSNGGTAVKALKVTKGSKITKPANPTKKGYKFANWYKDTKCAKVWNFTTDKVAANTTLYASWKKA